MRRGATYRVADFIHTAIPKRGSGQHAALFAHTVIEFLKALDNLQEANAHLTFTIHAGDALHLHYKGAPLFWILSGQRHMRIGLNIKWKQADQKRLFSLVNRNPDGLFKDKMDWSGDWRQWRLGADELTTLISFVKGLPADNPSARISDPSHPRNFPSEVRQLAYANFERGGSYCPGVPELQRKRHKVNFAVERIEYDHIIPYSKGGASSEVNLQVLCSKCNNAKRARIA